MLWRYLLTIISCWLLAAHFLRAGNVIMTGVCVLLPALLFLHRRWSVRALQVSLYCGTALWLRTAVLIARQRMRLGQPWGRMAVILGAVAVVTMISGLVLKSGPKTTQE